MIPKLWCFVKTRSLAVYARLVHISCGERVDNAATRDAARTALCSTDRHLTPHLIPRRHDGMSPAPLITEHATATRYATPPQLSAT